MSHDPIDLRGQEQARAEKARLEKHARQEEREDVKWLMRSKQGRRVAWRLLDQAGVFRLSYAGNSNDTIFREGMRNMGLRLMAQINEACPEQYNLMVQEQKNVRTSSGDGN